MTLGEIGKRVIALEYSKLELKAEVLNEVFSFTKGKTVPVKSEDTK